MGLPAAAGGPVKFEPFALRFDTEREAELVAEALEQLRCDNAPDALVAKNLRQLLAKGLGRERGYD